MKPLLHPFGQQWANWEKAESRTWAEVIGILNLTVRNTTAFSVKLCAYMHAQFDRNICDALLY